MKTKPFFPAMKIESSMYTKDCTPKFRIDGGGVGIIWGLEMSLKLNKQGGWNNHGRWKISLCIIAMDEFHIFNTFSSCFSITSRGFLSTYSASP